MFYIISSMKVATSFRQGLHAFRFWASAKASQMCCSLQAMWHSTRRFAVAEGYI